MTIDQRIDQDWQALARKCPGVVLPPKWVRDQQALVTITVTVLKAAA